MRLSRLSGLTLLGFGVAAIWLWRSPWARKQTRQLLEDTGIWRTPRLGDYSQMPGSGAGPGMLDLADENLTVTQRVRTNLGRAPELLDLPHLNINTEGRGVVYLRGYVNTEEQRRVAVAVAATTTGVGQVVNELRIEQAVNM